MVSVIVSFYERLEHLKCCLDALSLCSNVFDEVIVTDDGSCKETVDKLRKIIERYDFPTNHVWQTNRGFRVAAARNNGIRNARGSYLIFLDCDFVVLADTIKCHLDAARPGRFIAGGYINLDEGMTSELLNSPLSRDLLVSIDRQLPKRQIVKTHRRFIKRTILMRLRLASQRKQSLGGHYSIYRKDIERVNGYDENFEGWGGEDEDLGIRLVKAGIYCRSAIRYARVLHLYHPKELGEKHWMEGPNMKYFKRKEIPFFCVNGLEKASTSLR
ncbi:MAG: glycosyltransferase [Proteobacteria bacterium]|nr:glycosyltransferase [Pseudomonadota bacterium]MBU1902299.1 glycosyltransferase [Pseudomonadota bacterium]